MLKLLDTESSAFSIVNKCRKDPAPQPHNIKAKSATKPSQGKINTAATYDKILLSPGVSVLLIVPQGESSNHGGGWAMAILRLQPTRNLLRNEETRRAFLY
jgi:hypothetical protein